MFLAIPFFLLELYLSLKMGETIGFLWSAIWIVATIFIGTILLQNSPNAIMGQMQSFKKENSISKSFRMRVCLTLLGLFYL